jgi:integrase/recombinase XerD
MANWEAKLIVHREEKRIGIKADDNPYMNGEIRKFNDARWSKTLRCWHVPDTPFNRLRWNIELEEPESDEEIELQKKKTNERSNFVSQEIQKYLKDFRYYLKSMRYGENTIDVYSNALLSFLKFNSEKPIKELNNDDIIIYVNEYIVKKKLSISYHNQVFNAIKIFFEKVCKSKIETEKVFRPRKEKKLPNVLSKIEVKTILERTINNKHRTMLSLTYACGLRSGEVLSLKPKDIDSERNLMIVRQGKGKKDRVVPIGDKMIELLRVYYIQYQPKEYMFEGVTPGDRYDERSFQEVMKQAVKRSGINKPATLHWLRHSYATHLLEEGTDLRYIQEILGHKSSRTTEIYTHVSNRNLKAIKSPFDSL